MMYDFSSPACSTYITVQMQYISEEFTAVVVS